MAEAMRTSDDRKSGKKIMLGRGFSGSQGILAAAVMAVLAIAAAAETGAGISDIDIDMFLEHSRTTETLIQTSFLIVGALLFVFGAMMMWTNHDLYAMVSGALYVSAAVLMIITSALMLDGKAEEYMWISSFSEIIAGAVLYMLYAMSGKHGLTSGAMMVTVLGIAGAALAGGMTYSFGLMVASILAILVSALGEAAGIE
jgi:hypothetical protein